MMKAWLLGERRIPPFTSWNAYCSVHFGAQKHSIKYHISLKIECPNKCHSTLYTVAMIFEDNYCRLYYCVLFRFCCYNPSSALIFEEST